MCFSLISEPPTSIGLPRFSAFYRVTTSVRQQKGIKVFQLECPSPSKMPPTRPLGAIGHVATLMRLPRSFRGHGMAKGRRTLEASWRRRDRPIWPGSHREAEGKRSLRPRGSGSSPPDIRELSEGLRRLAAGWERYARRESEVVSTGEEPLPSSLGRRCCY